MPANASERFNESVEHKIKVLRNPDGGRLMFDNLKILRPDGDMLIEPFSFMLKAGGRLMISGPSGCGKSTILRALRGLWPWGSGTVTIDPKLRTLIVVQKPHLPLTSLKGIVCFPDHEKDYSDDAVVAALTKAGLGNLVSQMNDPAKDGSYWERLSGGEKQRVSFARAFLLKPAILGLDELTANLDSAAQDELYSTVLREMPDAIIISVSHRMELLKYHTQHAEIGNKKLALHDLNPPPPPAGTPPAP